MHGPHDRREREARRVAKGHEAHGDLAEEAAGAEEGPEGLRDVAQAQGQEAAEEEVAAVERRREQLRLQVRARRPERAGRAELREARHEVVVREDERHEEPRPAPAVAAAARRAAAPEQQPRGEAVDGEAARAAAPGQDREAPPGGDEGVAAPRVVGVEHAAVEEPRAARERAAHGRRDARGRGGEERARRALEAPQGRGVGAGRQGPREGARGVARGRGPREQAQDARRLARPPRQRGRRLERRGHEVGREEEQDARAGDAQHAEARGRRRADVARVERVRVARREAREQRDDEAEARGPREGVDGPVLGAVARGEDHAGEPGDEQAEERRGLARDLCGNQPLVWGVPTKLQNSLSRSNRSRFG